MLNYTRDQVDFFLLGIEEVQAERMKSLAYTVMAGARAEGKDFDLFIKQLDRGLIDRNFKDNFKEEEL